MSVDFVANLRPEEFEFLRRFEHATFLLHGQILHLTFYQTPFTNHRGACLLYRAIGKLHVEKMNAEMNDFPSIDEKWAEKNQQRTGHRG